MSAVKKFVFCEGKDDELVISCLARELMLDVTIEQYGGKDNLKHFLQGLSKRPEFARQEVKSMAILRDADENLSAAFASVRDTLRQNNFEAPDANEAFTEKPMKVGVFIVGVDGRGMVEDLCLKTVCHRTEFECVETFSRCIAQNVGRKALTSKEKVRVWMAWQEDYDSRVGKAATKGYWPWDSPAFDGLKQFLRAL